MTAQGTKSSIAIRTALAASFLAFSACADVEGIPSDGAEGPDVELASTDDALLKPNVWNLWPQHAPIPVCFDTATANNSTIAAWRRNVRTWLHTSISAVADVTFTGFGTCGASTGGTIVITYDSTRGNSNGGPTGVAGYLGASTAHGIIFGTDATNATNGQGVVIHEMMHRIGFGHEFNRQDNTAHDCSAWQVTGGQAGNTFGTPYDHNSIMNISYCGYWNTLSEFDAFGLQAAYGRRVNGLAILANAYGNANQDHAAVATTAGINTVTGSGYNFAYVDGWLFNMQVSGTVPLKTYWHAARKDNVITATAATENAVIAAGYQLVRTEGYVYPTQQPGTVPLRTFWNGTRLDHFTTSTAIGRTNALAAGYSEVRVEGYIFAQRPNDIVWDYWNAARGDNLSTGEGSTLAATADVSAYAYAGFDGAILRHSLPGTTALKTYWHAGREDHAVSANATTQQDLINAGYSFVRTEGYVFTSSGSNLGAMQQYYHSGRGDHYATLINGSWLGGQGYGFVRTEGYVLTLN